MTGHSWTVLILTATHISRKWKKEMTLCHSDASTTGKMFMRCSVWQRSHKRATDSLHRGPFPLGLAVISPDWIHIEPLFPVISHIHWWHAAWCPACLHSYKLTLSIWMCLTRVILTSSSPLLFYLCMGVWVPPLLLPSSCFCLPSTQNSPLLCTSVSFSSLLFLSPCCDPYRRLHADRNNHTSIESWERDFILFVWEHFLGDWKNLWEYVLNHATAQYSPSFGFCKIFSSPFSWARMNLWSPHLEQQSIIIIT